MLAVGAGGSAVAGAPTRPSVDPHTLPPVAVNPGDIAPWKNTYYANALAPGYWLEFSGSEWGTPISQWKNPQLNELGYPRYLERGKKLRSPLAGYGAQYPELSRGRVVLTWRGDADIRLSGASEYLAGESDGPATGVLSDGRRVYRFNGKTALSDLVIHRIDTPVRRIKVWLPDPANPEHASLEKELWHPLFIERLKDEDWGVIRTTSLTQTNGSPVRHWNNRYRPGHVFATGVRHPRNPAQPVSGVAGHRLTGVPYEHLVALANKTDMDLWIDIPHGATEPFVHKLARLLRFGSNGNLPYSRKVAKPAWAPLESGRRVFVAYSDKLWSKDGDSPQGRWAAAEAKAAGMSKSAFVALRTARVWKIFEEYFGDDRLVRVASTSATSPGYTHDYLSRLVDRAQVRPDIVAVESFFGGDMPDWVERTARERATSKDPWYYRGKSAKSLPADHPYWRSKDLARHLNEAFDEWQRRTRGGAASGDLAGTLAKSVDAIVGGVPVVAVGGPALRTDHLDTVEPGDEGVTLFTQAMSRHQRIAGIYRKRLDAQAAAGVVTHVPYMLSDEYTALGQWGHLEHIGQDPASAPKYAVLRKYLAEQLSASGSKTSNGSGQSVQTTGPSNPGADDADPVVSAEPLLKQLLSAWNKPGNWKSCEKVDTVGTAKMVGGRLRVIVSKKGNQGVRVYQKISGLVAGRKYRVTGKRYRGSQKSVGIRVSKMDCYNGTLAQDYGFNDNPNIDVKFTAASSTVYLSLYGGKGYATANSYLEFADLSVTDASGAAPGSNPPPKSGGGNNTGGNNTGGGNTGGGNTGGGNTGGGNTGGGNTGGNNTGGNNTPPANNGKARFSQNVINMAMGVELLRFGSSLPMTYPFGSAPPAVQYLALVAYLDPKARASNGTLVVDRLVKHLDNVVKPGNAPQLIGLQKGWHDHHVGAIIALARRNPAVWNKLSDATRKRLDWLMRIGTYTGNWQHNAANTCHKTIDMRVEGGYNPNQANPMAAWMSYAYIYFGGANAVNKVLAAYNPDSVVAAAKGYGWNWIVNTFTRSETRKLSTKGGRSSDGKCQINPEGVRKPFTFAGKISTGDLSHPQWNQRGAPVAYKPFNILKRAEFDWNMNAKVVDRQHSRSSCGQGHIKPGYKSPHLGKVGMFLEYNIGTRSSPNYVGYGAKQSLFHLTTLMATGYWHSGNASYDAVLNRYKIAVAVFRYREKDAKWWDTVPCRYSSGFKHFLGSEYANDLYDGFVGSGVKWKHAPVVGG